MGRLLNLVGALILGVLAIVYVTVCVLAVVGFFAHRDLGMVWLAAVMTAVAGPIWKTYRH